MCCIAEPYRLLVSKLTLVLVVLIKPRYSFFVMVCSLVNVQRFVVLVTVICLLLLKQSVLINISPELLKKLKHFLNYFVPFPISN
jgi:hypothetical protein